MYKGYHEYSSLYFVCVTGCYTEKEVNYGISTLCHRADEPGR